MGFLGLKLHDHVSSFIVSDLGNSPQSSEQWLVCNCGNSVSIRPHVHEHACGMGIDMTSTQTDAPMCTSLIFSLPRLSSAADNLSDEVSMCSRASLRLF